MWNDNYRKRRIINIILALVAVLLIVGLVFALLFARKKTEEQDAVLMEAYGQQQQEQSAARQEAVNIIQTEYDLDMQTIAEYMPGIVCWGDDLTTGSSGNVTFPAVLQTYIDTYISDIYDFRLAIDNAKDYDARVEWDDYTMDIPVVNMGAGQEDTSTVLGRCGAVPYMVKEDFTIPAGVESVPISIASTNGRPVAPLTGGGAGVNNVSIAGVEGTLTLDPAYFQTYGDSKYFFTRTTAGQEKPISAGAVITTSGTDMYRDYIHVICIGTYGGYDYSPAVLVEQTQALVARQTANSDRYIILGVCSMYEYWSSSSNYSLEALDAAMVQAFGNHYINVRKYLCTDGLTDAGISPSSDDKYDITLGIVPTSLRSASGDVQLNGKSYRLIGKLVYDRMQTLGYFDEISKELKINEARTALLKEDPDYFTKMLNERLK